MLTNDHTASTKGNRTIELWGVKLTKVSIKQITLQAILVGLVTSIFILLLGNNLTIQVRLNYFTAGMIGCLWACMGISYKKGIKHILIALMIALIGYAASYSIGYMASTL
ncbi:hypothetical protein ABCL16_003395 [Vibrio parahaemolyticus]